MFQDGCFLNWSLLNGQRDSGHRPCLFFARGSCQSGAECRYCHLDHSDRPAGLDKSQRQVGSGRNRRVLLALVIRYYIIQCDVFRVL